MSVALRRRGSRARTRAVPPRAATAASAAVAAPTGPYVGLVTRALAFAFDAAVLNVTAIAVTAVTTLAFSVLSLPDEVELVAAAVGGAIYLLWVVGYFLTFWTTTGQTPGDRLLRIRVQAAGGGGIRPRRALLRFVGLTLAALPLFAGFLMILVDDRRRGLHDRLARTVVVDAPREDDGARAGR